MNLFGNEFSLRTLRNDVCFLDASGTETLYSMAVNVFGREAFQWAQGNVAFHDGTPKSDELIWAALWGMNKAYKYLQEARWMFVPLKPSERRPALNAPSEEGRWAVAHAAQVELARDVFYELSNEILRNNPLDEKVHIFFANLLKDSPPQVTVKASAKVRKIATEAGL
ncbi:hypothetical protein AX768_23790 [Burkholderia sp. PAMC 28687]|uniref:hypothetical protein n=1 Tax=Burkholderia sp. PAMC 28687 TaxID=1795874 RepID=UPI0007849781|nr:hypothetical protein [Burkholderia sp. PAMC 28687]AMM17259.1 hypothetical protein AX768_23790 [Burkholderia sp. PAMC 28687]